MTTRPHHWQRVSWLQQQCTRLQQRPQTSPRSVRILAARAAASTLRWRRRDQRARADRRMGGHVGHSWNRDLRVTCHRINDFGRIGSRVSTLDPEFDPFWVLTAVFLVALLAANEWRIFCQVNFDLHLEIRLFLRRLYKILNISYSEINYRQMQPTPLEGQPSPIPIPLLTFPLSSHLISSLLPLHKYPYFFHPYLFPPLWSHPIIFSFLPTMLSLKSTYECGKRCKLPKRSRQSAEPGRQMSLMV